MNLSELGIRPDPIKPVPVRTSYPALRTPPVNGRVAVLEDALRRLVAAAKATRAENETLRAAVEAMRRERFILVLAAGLSVFALLLR